MGALLLPHPSEPSSLYDRFTVQNLRLIVNPRSVRRHLFPRAAF